MSTSDNLPVAKLIRTKGKGQTDGILTFGVQQIDTIEPPYLNNLHFVSCINEDDYQCTWAEMHDHPGHWHYRLEDKNGRSGIFIHKGIKVEDSKGCIVSDPVSIACLETWIPNHGDFLLKIRS